MDYLLVKWIHIVSSTILFGTGIGSAFYLLFVSLSKDVGAIAVISRYVVIADWLFTLTTAILQPLTGFYLLHLSGIPFETPWIRYSVYLYVVAIGCWLPVVWIQMRLRDMARTADERRVALPREYWRWLWIWAALGLPALIAFLLIFYLMTVKSI